MDEAQAIIDKEVVELEHKDYATLKTLLEKDEVITNEITGESGVEYQTSIRLWYDDNKSGVIRVSGAIYKPRNRRFFNFLGFEKSVASQMLLKVPDVK